MNNIFITVFISLLVAATLNVSGQGFLKTNGQEIINEQGEPFLLKGMGLGGWMLQEGYMMHTSGFANAQYQLKAEIEELIGAADTELFYDAWLENHVREIDIDSLKSWGFNSVRLPMHYNLYTLPIEDEPVAGENTWLTEGFEITDRLIEWCKKNQMYVILDLHAAPGGQGKDQGISDYDPTKPSLWESKENRDKTVALWKKLAERYVDEPWIGGYDLINETNWDLAGNIPLRDLFYEITDSIRAVDNNHIIFIEGNWFANDFTGLTPPWDNNMAYSPHKYWSFNDQSSIQWALDIREKYDVPIYLGETGENSNVWFNDAIKLFDDHNIGWAWWPMKKIESIAGPLSSMITPEYQVLLDYWNGIGSKPTAAYAKDALMETAESMKLENCIYQKDVIDAMFRQVESDETVPFRTQNIPGIVYPTDFDMGVVGAAYFDTDIANYQVSTGSFTSWNNGWVYRNDGVDIELTEDDVNTNGYNVGWVAAGEWMQYDVNVAESAAYEIRVRVASEGNDGKFHFGSGIADISSSSNVPLTGGWQTWQTVVISDVVLTPADNKLRFIADEGGYNLGSFEFIEKASSTSVLTDFISANTLDENTIHLNINKPLASPLPASPAGFKLFIDDSEVIISNVVLNTNSRTISLTINHSIKSTEVIKLSYTGEEIKASDGTYLNAFSLQDVKNTISVLHTIPGKVEAEDFFFQSGILLEDCTDVGGGKNISYLDAGDYCDYYIEVAQNGTYKVNYRTASESEGGQIELQLIDAVGEAIVLHTVSFPATGGWQIWETTSKNILLNEGQHHLRLAITEPLFNVNWFELSFLTSVDDEKQIQDLKLFPNPALGKVILKGTIKERQNVEIQLFNTLGQTLLSETLNNISHLNKLIDLRNFQNGSYFIIIRLENGEVYRKKIVKVGN